MLDVSLRAGVLDLLAELRRERGLSLLYITHDLLSARVITDELLVLYQGRIVERGPTRQVLQHPQHSYTVRPLDAVANPLAAAAVWGMSPSSTPDDTGGYSGYGVEGLAFPYFGTGATASNPNEGLSQCHGCATEDVVTPYASFLALDVVPQQAYANIQTLRALYPGLYGVDGFFDAVNPTTGAVGHRYLVLDESMIMASLDNALNNRAIQRDFARDPVSWAARTYLSLEKLSL